ncbi:MAG: NifB/NifX family molybdenum-iron cluster-binding protein [Candidatus Diapherotrites archaeon]|nr:NifB/NifX family molybdenum-iron cluster-binding protein [Candidatus Diapherotrites archaeon]
MKIAISVNTDDMDALVNPLFGRCAGFMIIEIEDGKVISHKFIPNPGKNQFGGAGTIAAQLVADNEINAIITGNVGPNALIALQSADIKIYTVSSIPIKDAIEAYLAGKLEEQVNVRNRGQT